MVSNSNKFRFKYFIYLKGFFVFVLNIFVSRDYPFLVAHSVFYDIYKYGTHRLTFTSTRLVNTLIVGSGKHNLFCNSVILSINKGGQISFSVIRSWTY